MLQPVFFYQIACYQTSTWLCSNMLNKMIIEIDVLIIFYEFYSDRRIVNRRNERQFFRSPMCFHAFKSPFRFTNVAPFSSARWHLADYVIASVTLFWWSIAKRTMLKKKLSFCQRKIDQLHRCWWRMLGKKCVGDNYAAYKIPQLASIVRAPLTLSSSGGDEFYTYRRLIHYIFTFASGANIRKMLPTSEFCHQHPNITMSPTPAFQTVHP